MLFCFFLHEIVLLLSEIKDASTKTSFCLIFTFGYHDVLKNDLLRFYEDLIAITVYATKLKNK